jgi:hypothetical protein
MCLKKVSWGGGKERGERKGRVMTQSLYAHMNKGNKIKDFLFTEIQITQHIFFFFCVGIKKILQDQTQTKSLPFVVVGA